MDLRSHISSSCAFKGTKQLYISVLIKIGSKTEIGKFDCNSRLFLSYKNVVELNIPMNEIVTMQKLDSFGYIEE